jgi:hypothetical protein
MNTLVTTLLSMVNVVAPNSPGLADAIKANSDSAKSGNSSVNALKASIASIRSPNALPPEKETPQACDTLDSFLDSLHGKLAPADFSVKSIKDSLAGWVSAIKSGYDGSAPSGRTAMRAGKTAVDNSIKAWNQLTDDADKAIQGINACAVSQIPDPVPAPQAAGPADSPPAADRLPPPLQPNATQADQDAYRQKLAAIAEQMQKIENWNNTNDAYQKWVAYQTNTNLQSLRRIAIAVMNGRAPEQVTQMKAIVAKAGEISKRLDSLDNASLWVPRRNGSSSADYIVLRGVTPTFQEMDQLSIEVTPLSFNVDDSGTFTSAEGTKITGSLNIRRYSKFAIEPGAGAVFATVVQPQYGTGTNDKGETVVKRVDNKKVSFSPSAMANFVCRCGVSIINPMLQVGASASKDTPGALIGGGIRFFGTKTGLGIGGGLMYAWVKDLQTLQVGSVVTGTAQIDADKTRLRGKAGGYFTIQYQF